ncbi:MAG: hypothetical protein F7C38_06785 [Desulfurococcales archaeon]|nr:hypothetical protein [Desulfurococcales archaeon]
MARVYISAAWRWDPEEPLPYADIGRLLFAVLKHAKKIIVHDADLDGFAVTVITSNPERLINKLDVIRLEKVKIYVGRGG